MSTFNLGFFEYDQDGECGNLYIKGEFFYMTKENQLEALADWIAELNKINQQIEQTSTTEESEND